MTHRLKKVAAFATALGATIALSAPMAALAQVNAADLGLNQDLGGAIGLSSTDPKVVAGRIINTALGFLGIIAVVIVLLGGFKYMVAGGNEEKTSEAKKLIVSGIIGLAIILSAWAITSFVISNLLQATSAA
jgi:hypothetical protein